MHQSSYEKMTAFRERHLADKHELPLAILDVGSYDVNGTYRPLFDLPPWRYEGADIEAGPNVDIALADPYRWREIPSESYDLVISGQAFEHIEYFWVTILELARVMKPGAIGCLIVPSAGPEHRYPVDCWRFFPDGLRALGRYAGLKEIETLPDWHPRDYDDGAVFKDMVYVFRRPVLEGAARLRESLIRWARLRTLTAGLPRGPAAGSG